MEYLKRAKTSALALGIGLALGTSALLAQAPETDDPERDAQSAPAQEDSVFDRSREVLQGGGDPHVGLPDEQPSSTDPGSFDELSEEHGDVSKFVEAVKAAGLEDALTDGTRYTIFAPNNEALEGEDLDELMSQENREDLVALLRAHIVADDVDAERAKTLPEARTIDGGAVELSQEDDGLMVGDAKALESDIELGSLRVYVIDGVLSPDRIRTASVDEQDADREPPSL
jgi:uncharacterized surface protein with fasciclin (FAS1) repeats